MDLENYFSKQRKKIDKALETVLPSPKKHPGRLHQAMRYAVFPGGKRLRPILCLAAAKAVGGNEKAALPAACALELVHSYSLAHDDLPAMDNDYERRGRPTCHRKFGESTAILAGDALLTLAFRVLAEAQAVQCLAEAIGSTGMVGGQAMDVERKGLSLDLPDLEYINVHKTGSLIAASLKLGALLGCGRAKEVEALYQYGKAIGLAFQIGDDILDGDGYAKILGAAKARSRAEDLILKGKAQLKIFGKKGEPLAQIADFIFKRKQ